MQKKGKTEGIAELRKGKNFAKKAQVGEKTLASRAAFEYNDGAGGRR